MPVPRDYSLRVTLSDEEVAKLKAEAERRGLTMADVIRQEIRKFKLGQNQNR